MRSEVSICNQALGWLGANLITSFQDGSKESNLCQANYEFLRDSVLEDTAWSFAVTRKELPALADAELGYGSAFQLPDECITVLQVFRDATFDPNHLVEYELEDHKILTDNGTCFVRYVFRQIDPVRFSPNFAQALAYRLATDLCIPLTKSRELQKQMFGLYQNALNNASATDGQQQRTRSVSVPWMNGHR